MARAVRPRGVAAGASPRGPRTAPRTRRSTAVPQLLAKPLIDVAAAVPSASAADACIEPLRALGYEYRGLHGDDPSRRYYVLNHGSRQFAHLHLYILPAKGWDKMLRFRDALRNQTGLAGAYAAEKCRVAVAVAWDKAAHAEAGDQLPRAYAVTSGHNTLSTPDRKQAC